MFIEDPLINSLWNRDEPLTISQLREIEIVALNQLNEKNYQIFEALLKGKNFWLNIGIIFKEGRNNYVLLHALSMVERKIKESWFSVEEMIR